MRCGVYFVIICSSSLLLIVPREGFAASLWHFLGVVTYIFSVYIYMSIPKHIEFKFSPLTLSSLQTDTSTFVNSADPDQTSSLIRIYTVSNLAIDL